MIKKEIPVLIHLHRLVEHPVTQPHPLVDANCNVTSITRSSDNEIYLALETNSISGKRPILFELFHN